MISLILVLAPPPSRRFASIRLPRFTGEEGLVSPPSRSGGGGAAPIGDVTEGALR